MTYVPYQSDWFYTKVHVPNLENIQQEFTEFFWKMLGDQVPETAGFFVLDRNDNIPDSLNTLLDYYGLEKKWCSINFSIVNNGVPFGGVHYDAISGPEKYVALNIPLLNCDGSFIVWYSGEPGPPIRIGPYNSNTQNIIFEGDNNQLAVDAGTACWTVGQVDELARAECTHPMLVHIGRPHQPVVTHQRLRVLLSVRFKPELSAEEFERLSSSMLDKKS